MMGRSDTPSAARRTDSNHQKFYSFDLRDFSPLKTGRQNYVMGAVSELQKWGPTSAALVAAPST
jgi:hypothetical protein